MEGRLDDGVLLGVEGPAEFVPLAGGDAELFTEAADFQAVLDARRCAVVARGQDPLFPDEDGTDVTAEAGAPGCPPAVCEAFKSGGLCS